MSLVIYGSSTLVMPEIVGPIMLIVLMFAIWPGVGNKGYFSGPTGLWRRILEWKGMNKFKLPSFREGENGASV